MLSLKRLSAELSAIVSGYGSQGEASQWKGLCFLGMSPECCAQKVTVALRATGVECDDGGALRSQDMLV